MSSFGYGKHTEKHIGVWLRYRSNPDIILLIKNSKLKRLMDTVTNVIVVEYDEETDEVFLQIWCKNLIDMIRGKERCNVFHIKTKVNEEWRCEGDMGSGLTMFEI